MRVFYPERHSGCRRMSVYKCCSYSLSCSVCSRCGPSCSGPAASGPCPRSGRTAAPPAAPPSSPGPRQGHSHLVFNRISWGWFLKFSVFKQMEIQYIFVIQFVNSLILMDNLTIKSTLICNLGGVHFRLVTSPSPAKNLLHQEGSRPRKLHDPLHCAVLVLTEWRNENELPSVTGHQD